MILRIRIFLPAREEWTSLLVSFGLHLLLVTVVLIAGTRSGATTRPLPAMTVRLSAGSAAASRPAQAKATPKPQARAKQKPSVAREEPVREKPRRKPSKPSKRSDATAPKNVSEQLEGVTAEPEALKRSKVDPPTQNEPATASSGDALPVGPIPGGIAGVETDEHFTADWYVQLVIARLTESWRERPVLPAGSPPRRVVVAFTILKDGRVDRARVQLPSGYSPLDYSAQRAVTSLRRLPPLPRSYDKSSLSARFVFELVPSGVH